MAPPLIKSATLGRLSGVVHGFTTRLGGGSTGPLASLNLAMRPGEDPGTLAANWAAALAAIGAPGAGLSLAHQTHGAAVLDGDAPAGPLAVVGDGDALIATRPGVVVAVRVADCVPILMAAPGAVAAVHAGWRGTVAEIATIALGALCERAGCGPGDVVAAIGPCVGLDRYEVGEPVGSRVEAIAPDRVDRSRARAHVDLGGANRDLLAAAGVGQIDLIRACTASRGDLYSHRADGPETGRQAALIGLLP